MAKTVSIELTMKVKNAAGTVEAQRVLSITDATPTEATQLFPQKIAANQANVSLNLGGVTNVKFCLLSFDKEVTLKFNQSGDTGCLAGSGPVLLQSTTGITAIFVTTGANETQVELLAVGT